MSNYCVNCGARLDHSAAFCPASGAAALPDAGSVRALPLQGGGPGGPSGERRISEHITLCADGKYRWIYSYSLYKNPGLFFLIWRIFFFILLGAFGLMTFLALIEGDLDGERLLDTLKYFGIALLGMTALVGVSYLIYAAIMGGKYVVLFELDDSGINHKQIEAQARRARAIGSAAATAGLLAGRLSTVAAGRNIRTEMRTDFRSTGKVLSYPRKNLIKLREALSYNQVYTYPEDFGFVLNYILARVPDRARPPAERQG